MPMANRDAMASFLALRIWQEKPSTIKDFAPFGGCDGTPPLLGCRSHKTTGPVLGVRENVWQTRLRRPNEGDAGKKSPAGPAWPGWGLWGFE